MKIFPSEESIKNALRFHRPHHHLTTPFGSDWFGLKAEGFARFFGTPTFLGIQSILVFSWVLLNIIGWVKFDLYPFILLNLVFSLQSAYAAPLILLAQTRQADRDKCITEADALHREDLATENAARQKIELQNSTQILRLLEQNTKLTETVHDLSRRIQVLTEEINDKLH